MSRKTSLFALLALTTAAAAIGSAACTSKASGGPAPTPTVSGTPFIPVGCQVVWVTKDPVGQSQTIDYYLVDAPVGKWVIGTNGYYVGDSSGATNVEGAFVRRYDLVTLAKSGAAVASSGTFTIGLSASNPLEIGNPVTFSDTTAQDYYTLDTAGVLQANQGPSGVGTFTGTWSDPGSPDVTPGTGTLQIAFLGTSFTLGQDLSYGLCYTATSPFAAMSRQQKIAEAGRRAAELLEAN